MQALKNGNSIYTFGVPGRAFGPVTFHNRRTAAAEKLKGWCTNTSEPWFFPFKCRNTPTQHFILHALPLRAREFRLKLHFLRYVSLELTAHALPLFNVYTTLTERFEKMRGSARNGANIITTHYFKFTTPFSSFATHAI